jgi:hypothetical protein
MVSFSLIIVIICIGIGNHFAVLYIKKCALKREWVFLFPLILFIIFWLLNREHIIGFNSAIFVISNKKIVFSCIIIFFICWFLLTSIALLKEMKHNFYFENTIGERFGGFLKNIDLFYGRNNVVFKLVENELKMFFRNKRPRSLLYSAIFSIVYGFIIFRNDIQEKNSIIFIAITGIIISGIIVNNYAQYLFAWQSDNLEFILTTNIKVKDFFLSKFYVCDILNIVSFVLLLPYIIKYYTLTPILISAVLYNIGIQPILSIFFATFNYKYIDINQPNDFNYQGFGVEQLIYVIANGLLASILYASFTLILNSWISVITIGLIGVINIIFRKYWIALLVGYLNLNKHKMLNGFRLK